MAWHPTVFTTCARAKPLTPISRVYSTASTTDHGRLGILAGLSFSLGMARPHTLDHPGAIAAYRQALGHNPRYERALYGLVISHLILGQDDKARRYYQNLRLLDPQLAAELSEHF